MVLSVVFSLLLGVRRQWPIGPLEELFYATGHAPQDAVAVEETDAGASNDGDDED